MPDKISVDEVKVKLTAETARINWRELEKFFAQGKVLVIDAKLDLVEVAVEFATDQVNSIGTHIDQGEIAAPSNDQARSWHEQETPLWSVVVAPYVLVQEKVT